MELFWGKVVKGKQRGHDLGFPTANLRLHRQISEGIYISTAKLSGKTYPALTFIGTAKTFNEILYQAETFLLDSKHDLYGKWLSIRLHKKIRGNQKFRSEEELIKQMKQDEAGARSYFQNKNPHR